MCRSVHSNDKTSGMTVCFNLQQGVTTDCSPMNSGYATDVSEVSRVGYVCMYMPFHRWWTIVKQARKKTIVSTCQDYLWSNITIACSYQLPLKFARGM